MIGKVPKPGKSFKGLISYLVDGDKTKPLDPTRVAWTETRNLITDDPKSVVAIMRATAALSKRVKKPVYHYVISWHRDEAPTDDLMRQVADTTCEDLGLEDHQTFYIAHKDTEHRHVHIVVNRVHPETTKAWRTSHDYRRIEQSLRRQSEFIGLDYVPGPHNDPDAYNLKNARRRPKDATFRKPTPAGKRSTPARKASNSLSQERKDAFLLVYKTAANWAEFSGSLACLGFRIESKGQGLLIHDGETCSKLSSIDKSTRLRELEARFGEKWSPTEALPTSEDDIELSGLKSAEARSHLTALLKKTDQLPPEQANVLDHTNARAVRRQALRNAAKDKKPTEAELMFENYQETQETADFAYTLLQMGLITAPQMQRAIKDREAAQAALDQTRGTLDQLTRDATSKLFNKRRRPDPEPAKSEPPTHEPTKPRSRRR